MSFSLTSLAYRAFRHHTSYILNKKFSFWVPQVLQVAAKRNSAEITFVPKKHYYETKFIRPPRQEPFEKIEDKYADALYAAAVKSDNLKQVESDIQTLQTILEKDPQLRYLFSDPRTSRKVQKKDMEAVLSRLFFCSQTKNFLFLLVENRRISNIESIIQSFQSLVSSSRGDVICEVTTAEDLDDALRKKIEDLVRKVYKEKRAVKYLHNIDPKIIGGIIVKVGDYRIDMSIAKRMRELTNLLSDKL